MNCQSSQSKNKSGENFHGKKYSVTFFKRLENGKKSDKIDISEAYYKNVAITPTKTTNESALRYLLKSFPLDKVFIFASKKVRDEIVGYRAEDGKTRTHLAFSIERFKEFLPDEDRYFVFDYDEDGSDNDNLRNIAMMARHVQNFAAGEKVTLHVDLTGGMRHVNMMMLELTRLLEYSGLTVGKILYSNYKKPPEGGIVEEIQNVYDIFQLMAGVEEFVNFGSVKALDIYYVGRRNNLSEPLRKLLDAMKTFAEAIKLCHYGQFNRAIKDLHDAVHDFDKHISDDVEDILMSRLIGRIQENYHDLIAVREKDDLRIIRWCVDNDYLQQALTLYTERIPEYLGENKIITQTETEAKNLAELVDKDKIKLNPWFYLFSNVTPKNLCKFDDGKKIFCKAVKAAAICISNKKQSFDFDKWLADLNKRLAPLELHCTDETNFRAQFETLAEIFNAPQLLIDLSSPELEPIRKIIDALSQELEAVKWGKARLKIIAKFFNQTITADDVPYYFHGSGFMKYPKAIKMLALLDEKIFSTAIPQENFLSIADKYFRIKDERNHSAHAREDYGEFRTADKLREVMNTGLDEIKRCLPAQ